ncbi:MAG: GAF domain-containing protein, partial [Acidimicrobiia bacterium]|nr:GAF domain-containing protein [Acidimicrobiia bacterium]
MLLGDALDWVVDERPAELEVAVRQGLGRHVPAVAPPAPTGEERVDPTAAVVTAMTDALAGDPGVPLPDRLSAASAALADHLGAPSAGVWMPAEGALVLVAAGPGAGGLRRDSRLPTVLPPSWLMSPHATQATVQHTGTLVAFPLVVDRRSRGFMGARLDGAPTTEALDGVQRLAAELGRSLRRELRHGQAVARADAWQRLATALSAAVTVADVARVVAEHAGATVDATSCALALPGPGRAVLHVGDPRLGPGHASYDDLLPLAEVLRTGRVVTAESPAAVAERYPGLDGGAGADALASVIAAPVRSPRGVDVAAIAFGWPTARRLGPTGRAELSTLAELCSQSLERARLFQKEARERRSAESAVDRLRRLQRATAALSAPLPFPAAARAVLREAVALLGGGGGLVAVAGPTGDLELLARTGSVPGDGAWRAPGPGGLPGGVRACWLSGVPAGPPASQ